MNYMQWTSLPDRQFETLDVAFVNLSAAAGLPGWNDCDIHRLVSQIDHWTDLVAVNTAHWRRKFAPSSDCKSEAEFRMMAMLTVVQRDLKVRYNSACMSGPYDATDSRNQFIHGPLTGHGGTCCSLPFLYLAIGRRLGYPLFAVEAREHLFVRWDGDDERFNVEFAGVGFRARDDEHYKSWPFPLSSAELASGLFLRNFSRRDEVAHAIATRGHCLMDHLRLLDAMEALSYATTLDRRYRTHWAVATIMQRIVAELRAGDFPGDAPLEELIQLVSPTPVEPWEHWALPRAQQELLRIVQLHSTRTISPFVPSESFTVTA